MINSIIPWVTDGRKKPRYFYWTKEILDKKLALKVERSNMKYWLTVKTNHFSYVIKDTLPNLSLICNNIYDEFHNGIPLDIMKHGSFQRFKNGFLQE